jgi:alkanesulfonate monooxygenase SsuD/methylene tetrahydromethanopterin reductase-like flavin-dependent oxidoreductase (luciferase family)
MRISISLPKPGETPEGTVAACLRLAVVSEDAGAHAVAATDHPFPHFPPGGAGHHSHDPFTLLGYLAGKTSTVQLQISLLVAGYRNPNLAARMISTLDQVSEGRALITLGAGYQEGEYAGLGRPFEQRGKLVREAVTAMRAAWTGEPVHASGIDWTADGNSLNPGCIQEGGPQLWRGGNAPGALKHIAKELDGWAALEVPESRASKVRTTGLQLEGMKEAVSGLHELWKEAGREGLPDVAFVRVRTDWLADEGRLREEIETLADAGVTWVEINPAGTTIDEQEQSVKQTLATLDKSGLLS